MSVKSHYSTEDELVKLLKSRFGSVNQAERFRALLSARRRKKGEKLQAVYHDIRCLLTKAYQGEIGPLVEIVGRDA